LAKQIGLNPDEWKDWLSTSATVKTAPNGEFVPRNALRTTTVICPGFGGINQVVVGHPDVLIAVPNTILCWWGGDVGDIGKSLVGWDDDRQYFRDLGFYVDTVDDPLEFAVARYEYLSGKKMLHGFFAWAHGSEGSRFIGSSDDWTDHKERTFVYLKDKSYGLGLVILEACFSDPGGKVLVADSPAAKFWGATKILKPVNVPNALAKTWLLAHVSIFDKIATSQSIDAIGFQGPTHPQGVITRGQQETNK